MTSNLTRSIAVAITTYENGNRDNFGAEDPNAYAQKWDGWANSNLNLAAAIAAAVTPPLVRSARAQGYDVDAQLAHLKTTNMLQAGDCELRWVNKADITRHDALLAERSRNT